MSAATYPTIGEPKIPYGRAVYLPAWTPVFTEADMDNQVFHEGTGLGFKIRDVLPERRWAVTPAGDTISQRDFEDQYRAWASSKVVDNRIIPIKAANSYFDTNLISVPRVERFVAVALDYNGKEVRIGFDPNKPPDKSAAPIVLRDANGKEVNPLSPTNDKVAKLTLLSELKEKGVISAEQLSSEMAATLLEPQAAGASVPQPPDGFSAVADEQRPRPYDAGRDKEVVAIASPCGRQSRSKAGAMAHERSCAKCNEQAAPPPLEAA